MNMNSIYMYMNTNSYSLNTIQEWENHKPDRDSSIC